MAKQPEAAEAVVVKTIWGVSVKEWVGILQMVGIPGVFMVGTLVLGYLNLPPVVRAQIQMMDRTGTTLESMDATLLKIQTQQYPSPDFRAEVDTDHARAELKIDQANVTLEQIKTAVEGD